MNSIKVTTVLSHIDPNTNTEVWGCEGTLILIKDPIGIVSVAKEGHSAIVDCYNPVIISETEEIKAGDACLSMLTKQICEAQLSVEMLKKEYPKIIAFPENFSASVLEAIASEKIKDGDKIFMQCEKRVFNNGTSDNPPDFYYIIKLDSEGHIIPTGSDRKNLAEAWNDFYRKYYTETGKRADTASGVIDFVEWMTDNCYPPVRK